MIHNWSKLKETLMRYPVKVEIVSGSTTNKESEKASICCESTLSDKMTDCNK